MTRSFHTTPVPCPTPFLLDNTQGELHIQRQWSVDYQRRCRPPATMSSTECVLILTRISDNEVDRLSLELAAERIPVVRIDADDCWQRSLILSLRDSGYLVVDGTPRLPIITWRRHFTTDAINVAAPSVVQKFLQRQWEACADLLSNCPSSSYAINGTGSVVPLDRLTQLRYAGRVMPVPASCMSTSAQEAANHLGLSPESLLAKVIGDHFVEYQPSTSASAMPRRVTGSSTSSTEPVPMLFQEFVESTHELRVYVFDSVALSYTIRKSSAADLWQAADKVDVRPAALTADQRGLVRRLQAEMGVDVGAFDFLVRPDGGLVFLEVNMDGDWAWFEDKAGDDRVSAAALAFLVDKYREVVLQ